MNTCPSNLPVHGSWAAECSLTRSLPGSTGQHVWGTPSQWLQKLPLARLLLNFPFRALLSTRCHASTAWSKQRSQSSLQMEMSTISAVTFQDREASKASAWSHSSGAVYLGPRMHHCNPPSMTGHPQLEPVAERAEGTQHTGRTGSQPGREKKKGKKNSQPVKSIPQVILSQRCPWANLSTCRYYSLLWRSS